MHYRQYKQLTLLKVIVCIIAVQLVKYRHKTLRLKQIQLQCMCDNLLLMSQKSE